MCLAPAAALATRQQRPAVSPGGRGDDGLGLGLSSPPLLGPPGLPPGGGGAAEPAELVLPAPLFPPARPGASGGPGVPGGPSGVGPGAGPSAVEAADGVRQVGWVRLRCRVRWPLDAVVTPPALDAYAQCFALLLQVLPPTSVFK